MAFGVEVIWTNQHGVPEERYKCDLETKAEADHVVKLFRRWIFYSAAFGAELTNPVIERTFEAAYHNRLPHRRYH